MDASHFDTLARSFTPARSRRGALAVVFGGTLVLVGFTKTTAKRKKRKKTGSCPSGDVNCSEFATHNEAQRFFEKCGGPQKDSYGLDTDHDGIACESLPA